MIFKIKPNAGQPIYLQLMQQIQHAVEVGVLQQGDMLPGIRTLAEELVVSHNTIAKAYSELEHAGILELRHGSGAYVTARRPTKSRSDKIRLAQKQIGAVIKALRQEGFSESEIRRLFEAELLHSNSAKEPA